LKLSVKLVILIACPIIIFAIVDVYFNSLIIEQHLEDPSLPSEEILEQFSMVLTMLIVLITITAGTLGYLFSIEISRPIEQLKKASNEIAKGNFILEIKKEGPKEIRELAEDVETMAQKLEELRDQIVKAERLSSIGELSSRLAHDIRNPLSVIKNAAVLIETREKGKLDAKSMEYISIMLDQINIMSQQINHILEFVRTKPIKMEKISVTKLAHEAKESLEIDSDFEIDYPEEDVEIDCDIEQMRIVFNNLILNAFQASDSKPGKIEIRCKEKANKMILEFQDFGRGISKKDIKRIFEPLFTTKQMGIGLGLVSCKTIIEQHKGTIQAANTKSGALFTIMLPKN
jgi:signal transduction histidine kinase